MTTFQEAFEPNSILLLMTVHTKQKVSVPTMTLLTDVGTPGNGLPPRPGAHAGAPSFGSACRVAAWHCSTATAWWVPRSLEA